MLYRLAEDLGIWDVQRLEREMEMPQFQEWIAYRSIKAEKEREARMEARAESNRRNAKQLL